MTDLEKVKKELKFNSTQLKFWLKLMLEFQLELQFELELQLVL